MIPHMPTLSVSLDISIENSRRCYEMSYTIRWIFEIFSLTDLHNKGLMHLYQMYEKKTTKT